MKIHRKQNIELKKPAVLAAGASIVCILLISGWMSFRRQRGSVSVNGGMDTETSLGDAGRDTEQGRREEKPENQKDAGKEEETLAVQYQEVTAQADRLSLSYDYEGAAALIRGIEGYEGDKELKEKLASYEKGMESCEPVNIQEVTHVFYHSLVVDPQRAFANQDRNPQAAGNNQWMTTVSEFKKIIQEMYDRGYVIVGIHDILKVSADENGNTIFEPGEIMLPKGKKAYVLSQDDLSYYHCYDNYGYAAKMILDEEGKPTCEYITQDGEKVTGDYDIVPILDKFIEEHPDASYRGAKGIIALTGYNGILGYRTDKSYLNVDGNLDDDKRQWLLDNPDFDIEKEREQAKKVADALKEDGWEFASHTWGHIKIRDASFSRLMRDTQKWRENVEPLVGNTDVIVFAHGQDLGDWGNYDENNEKFQFLKGEGYQIFCNVDQGQYRVYFGRDYLRQGRRDLDGYRIYRNAEGKEDSVSDLFDAKEIIDPLRPPVPPLW